MRFLKTLTLNRRAIYDDRVAVQTDSSVIMNTTNNLLIPKGTTADRPASPSNGMIRYNTDLNTPYGELEVYQGGSWRRIRYQEPNAVVLDPLGTGDDIEEYFGPLNPDPFTYTAQAGVTWDAAQIALNLIVVVENVYQIGTQNFEVVQNPATGPNAPYAPGTYIHFFTPVPDTKEVYVFHKFDQ